MMDLRIDGSRPSSARPESRINPITGEDLPYSGYTPRGGAANNTFVTWNREKQTPGSRPKGVPALNLGKLTQDDDIHHIPLELDPYKYKLDTPNSASTVSWGTPHSTYRQQNQAVTQAAVESQRSARQGQYNVKNSHRSSRPAQKTKQVTAWDRDPVPDNLPAPPEKYKEQYKQYKQDMRDSYRKHTNRAPTQDEVDQNVSQIRLDYPQTERIPEDDSKYDIQKGWTQQPYSTRQLNKKQDVEEFEAEKRKNKLIETVMIDQLSRAVISDPEQNQVSSRKPMEYYPGMKRGTVRTLHDSRVKTSGTATENLLSKKVRFGARVFTRIGRDAIRELTGFFFAVDNSITVYEFRQFGKTAKAMPFIKRGVYRWLRGRRRDEMYSLLDISQGSTLHFPTLDQPLPDSLKASEYISVRITDLDQAAKDGVLTEGVPRKEQEDLLQQLYHSSRLEVAEDQQLIWNIQEMVHGQLKKRGIRTITGLGSSLRELDRDRDGMINKVELEKALLEYHINIPQDQFDELWGMIDDRGTAYMDYYEFMRIFISDMGETRKMLVRKAFHKVDGGKNGVVSKSELRKFYNAHKHPKVKSGDCREEEVLEIFLEAFSHSQNPKEVTYSEFEDYYEGLSLCVDSDQDFENILKNSWSI